MIRKIIALLANKGVFNNIVTNNILMTFGLDGKFAKYINLYNYKNEPKENETKSLQEIAGYSLNPGMEKVLSEVHAELAKCKKLLGKDQKKVLDIGCGPGLYLNDFDESFIKYGIDISPGMIEFAQKEVPKGNFHVGDFLDVDVDTTFDLIFSVGTIVYFNKGSMKRVKDKLARLLNPNGLLFISYPHAISKKDLYYPDITYIQYSPNYIEKLFEENFEILSSYRAIDKKKIGDFDDSPFQNPKGAHLRTYMNSSIIVMRKKG